jgi:sec-independent protein translocase protein TatC
MAAIKKNKLTLLGHLEELRNRLLKCALMVLITTTLSFVFADQIFQFLTRPSAGYPLIYIDMTEMFSIYMQVCIIAGIALAMPYLLYQVIMFIFPALTVQEKKYILIVIPWIFLMFISGVVFCYFILIPPGLKFLFNFGTNIASPQIRIGSYITVITRLVLVSGIMFELPVVTTFLARLGLITSGWLASKRKFAFILAFIVGAVITPTGDPINQSLVAGPIVILYEMSIWLARLVQQRRVKVINMPVVAG